MRSKVASIFVFSLNFARCATALVLSVLLFFTGVGGVFAETMQSVAVRVTRIDLRGNTVLSSLEVSTLVSQYEGKELMLEELKQVAAKVEEAYRQRGYFVARAYLPTQEIKGGVVWIEVIEGRIGDVHVEGNRFYGSRFIVKRLSQPTGEVLRYGPFQRSILLLNEFPDLTVKSVFSPGKEEGTTDLLLKVHDRRPLHVGLDYDNFGNQFIGEKRMGLSLSAGNLVVDGDLFSLRGVHLFSSLLNKPFIQGTYSFPINLRDMRVSFSYANGEFRVGNEFQPLDIRGESDVYGLGVTAPLRRTATGRSDISFTLVSKSAHNFIQQNTSSRDELREMVLDYQSSWLGDGMARNLLSVALTQGVRAFGATEEGDSNPGPSRQGSGDDFAKLTFSSARVDQLFPGLFLVFRGAGQVAVEPLAVMEQYSLGGADTVRGYEQAEFLGDFGYNVSAEVQKLFLEREGLKVQGAIFVDYGFVGLVDRLPGEAKNHDLTGVGIGLRVNFGKWGSGRLDVGFPVESNRPTGDRSSIVYGQIAFNL